MVPLLPPRLFSMCHVYCCMLTIMYQYQRIYGVQPHFYSLGIGPRGPTEIDEHP